MHLGFSSFGFSLALRWPWRLEELDDLQPTPEPEARKSLYRWVKSRSKRPKQVANWFSGLSTLVTSLFEGLGLFTGVGKLSKHMGHITQLFF